MPIVNPESLVDSWSLIPVDMPGWDDFDDSVVAEVGLPTEMRRPVAGFDDSVVMWAEERQIVNGRGAAGLPWDQMVCFTCRGWPVAAGEDASLVAGDECSADGWGDEPVFAADVEDAGGAAEHDGEDAGVAGQSSELAGGDLGAGGQDAGFGAVGDQIGMVDGHDDAGTVTAVVGCVLVEGGGSGEGDECVGAVRGCSPAWGGVGEGVGGVEGEAALLGGDGVHLGAEELAFGFGQAAFEE